jgi:predicted DNA-binding transcriptional regulator AlpA
MEDAMRTPRGLDRIKAAEYIGASPSSFDKLVAAGSLPQPKRVSLKRYVWDRRELDCAFDKLPTRKTGGDW